MNIQRLILVAAALFVGGCGTFTETYQISVKNDTTRPVVVWLTKDGPPPEPNWLSPEQLAATTHAGEERLAGVLLPPGKTATVGPVKGTFQKGTHAVLRVYEGSPKFNEILAISPGNPRRVNRRLDPGAPNDLRVIDDGGQIDVVGTPHAAPDR